MTYSIESAVSEAAKAYVESAVDMADFAAWPVVTWFDPMAAEIGNRIVCICGQAQSHETSPGNFEAELEVGVRSNWSQPTAQADREAHFEIVKQLRDVFNASVDTLSDALDAQCPDGFSITYVDQRREYNTEVNEGNYYSSVRLTVSCHAIE